MVLKGTFNFTLHVQTYQLTCSLCKMFISCFMFSLRKKICEYAANVCFVIHNIFTSKKILILLNVRVLTLHLEKKSLDFSVKLVATAFVLL